MVEWVNVKLNNLVLVQKIFSLLYSNFILNLWIYFKVYELNNNYPRDPANNFALKKLFAWHSQISKKRNKY